MELFFVRHDDAENLMGTFFYDRDKAIELANNVVFGQVIKTVVKTDMESLLSYFNNPALLETSEAVVVYQNEKEYNEEIAF